ncbi:GTP cyclohydrolase 1 type 2/Nif3 [Protomyces lactucae-debilis]|uniref:GTP cyclohydrolase 1 type 2/Nif3 n=1 Tax=Protomyces lactucae-debilis TaxID=2754530 RepID=A0A1Y2F977_PROLT|nr:GTP cyclohydrolase 1 type 2/Nif3 [Protomyces lactucae-debilis]ORY80468.1 GTP cyclohydrolase 1 type 2/Nif3 [Protomyces lactucae-debilis]
MGSDGNKGLSQAVLLDFFAKLLPPQASNARDKLIYHQPGRRRPFHHLLLSITATEGLYSRLTPNTCLFLHRPWALDRHRVPHGCLVLSSHFRFDETLTVGFNPHLAGLLGCKVETLVTLSGYKNDPERRIGILGVLQDSQSLHDLQNRLAHIFQEEALETVASGSKGVLRAVALMNAFGEEQVNQVAEHFWTTCNAFDPVPASQVLYITGEPRPAGLERSAALGMPVIFIGHRAAEAWGIRRLAELLQVEFPDCLVEASFEPEAQPALKPESQQQSIEP